MSAAIACILSLASSGAASATAESLESGLWYFERGNVQAAHDAGFDGSGVTVAVIDSQINPEAIGLRGADLHVREDSFCFDETGEPYPAVSTDYPLAGHGTSVASMIVGTGEAPAGGIPIKGVAPGVKLLYYNAGVYGGDGDSDGDSQEVDCILKNGEELDADGRFALGQAISQAVDDGADIISISQQSSITIDKEVAKAYAAGVVVIGAMPNEGGIAGRPASMNGVVAVQAFDAEGRIQSSTSGVPNVSEDVEIAAPGIGILNQGSAMSWDDQQLWSGTSLATPIVAGFMAVVKQKFPDATANQLIQSLIHNAGGQVDAEPAWSNTLGYGAISLTAMLQVDPSRYPDVNPLFDPDDPFGNPSTSQVAAAVAALQEASPEPSAATDALYEESPPALPWLIGGGVVLAVLLVGGVVLAIVLTTSSRRRSQHDGEPDRIGLEDTRR